MTKQELEHMRIQGEEKRQTQAEEDGLDIPKPRRYGFCIKCSAQVLVPAWRLCHKCKK